VVVVASPDTRDAYDGQPVEVAVKGSKPRGNGRRPMASAYNPRTMGFDGDVARPSTQPPQAPYPVEHLRTFVEGASQTWRRRDDLLRSSRISLLP
jgi:hypothetical protein